MVNHLQVVPQEILNHMIGYLDHKSMGRFARVDKNINQAVAKNEIYKAFEPERVMYIYCKEKFSEYTKLNAQRENKLITYRAEQKELNKSFNKFVGTLNKATSLLGRIARAILSIFPCIKEGMKKQKILEAQSLQLLNEINSMKPKLDQLKKEFLDLKYENDQKERALVVM